MIESLLLSAPELESCIISALQTIGDRLIEMVTSADEIINSPTSYLAKVKGKRLRPVLAPLTTQPGDPVLAAAGEKIRDAGATVEPTYIATLRHDDVMNETPLCRGASNVQIVRGNSTAILTGDVLVAQASQLVVALGPEAVVVYAKTFERLCMDQFHKTLSRPAGAGSIDRYIQILAGKTGSLITVSVCYGAMFTGAETRTEQIVKEFGERVGVAFQLADDVIDLMDSLAATGKVLGTDLHEGADTMPVLPLCKVLTVDELDTAGQVILPCLFSSDLFDDTFLSDAVARLREHSVPAHTHEIVMDRATQTVKGLEGLEEVVLDGTRQRLAQVGTEGEVAVATMTDTGERIRQMHVAMEDFARILVDRAA